MRTKTDRPKRSPLDGYKTYDPDAEGFGDSAKWRSAFRYRMGMDAAREAVGSKSPLAILFGEMLPIGWLARTLSDQWMEIKSAWRKLVKAFHPDNQETGNADKFKKVQGAYEILEDKYRTMGAKV